VRQAVPKEIRILSRKKLRLALQTTKRSAMNQSSAITPNI
jgi:hypothetical protein